MSENEYINSGKYKKSFGKDHPEWSSKLPNGKWCCCDPEFSCTFHREGKILMEFFNITEKELK